MKKEQTAHAVRRWIQRPGAQVWTAFWSTLVFGLFCHGMGLLNKLSHQDDIANLFGFGATITSGRWMLHVLSWLEGLFFGFHVYWVSYVFIWPLLVVLAMFLRRLDLFQGEKAALPWAVAAAFWGLLFGPLMYIPWFCIMGGWEGYFAMWIAGIPFDLTHAAGNFVFTLVLYWPLYKVLAALTGRKT